MNLILVLLPSFFLHPAALTNLDRRPWDESLFSLRTCNLSSDSSYIYPVELHFSSCISLLPQEFSCFRAVTTHDRRLFLLQKCATRNERCRVAMHGLSFKPGITWTWITGAIAVEKLSTCIYIHVQTVVLQAMHWASATYHHAPISRVMDVHELMWSAWTCEK